MVVQEDKFKGQSRLKSIILIQIKIYRIINYLTLLEAVAYLKGILVLENSSSATYSLFVNL